MTHIKEVVDGSLPSGGVLDNEAKERKHGKAGVLDLLKPPVSDRRSGAGA